MIVERNVYKVNNDDDGMRMGTKVEAGMEVWLKWKWHRQVIMTGITTSMNDNALGVKLKMNDKG